VTALVVPGSESYPSRQTGEGRGPTLSEVGRIGKPKSRLISHTVEVSAITPGKRKTVHAGRAACRIMVVGRTRNGESSLQSICNATLFDHRRGDYLSSRVLFDRVAARVKAHRAIVARDRRQHMCNSYSRLPGQAMSSRASVLGSWEGSDRSAG